MNDENAKAASAVGTEPLRTVTIEMLQTAHVRRQEEWCPEQKPDLSFRGNEMAGEVGEACNVIKKLERERHGWRGSRATKEQLAEELGDVVHTAILCAITAGIDLAPAVEAKFNATSEKNGLSPLRAYLASQPEQPAPAAVGVEAQSGLLEEMTAEVERLTREREEIDAHKPHFHMPSYMHMGDCAICGNVADSPNHIKNADWKARAEAAEAKIAYLRAALEGIRSAADSFCDESGDEVAGQVRLRVDAALSRLKQEDQPAPSKETTR